MTKEKFEELADDPGSVFSVYGESFHKGRVYRSIVLTVGDEHWMMTEMSDDRDCEYCEDAPVRVEPYEETVVKYRPVAK